MLGKAGETGAMNNWPAACMACMDSMVLQCTRWVHSVDGKSRLPTINPACAESACKNAEKAISKLKNRAFWPGAAAR